ncbi:hypothetical protein FAM14222_002370 [Propionibacterium freudenreichii]|uniref:NAD(P)-binding domain-containing protein n=1 Tax=Propionibacterium freudenreichii TaxID=1744 RepID=UPI001561BFC0|nr:hypothetical protein [Propionibacterium freudenreichii]WFF34799.1 hypothetical protein FAM19025_001989 [Propionibacterium freudenreichii]WFF37028.1 hypothetical protein FAM14221_001988 [Propionibacterium freudenreichii]
MRVAVIGVGDMGAEMIPHLVETDFEIVAYDKLPERLQAGEGCRGQGGRFGG